MPMFSYFSTLLISNTTRSTTHVITVACKVFDRMLKWCLKQWKDDYSGNPEEPVMAPQAPRDTCDFVFCFATLSSKHPHHEGCPWPCCSQLPTFSMGCHHCKLAGRS